jgi:hypothetical protein
MGRQFVPEQDWRLEAGLDAADPHGPLDRLLGAVRHDDGHAADDVRAAVAHDIAITHDGRLLFAYAQTESELSSARRVIEGVLARDGIAASVRVSHWDTDLDEWRQSDPPLRAEEARTDEAIVRDEETVETQTMVCSAGKLVRESIERAMRTWADQLELSCQIVEHPHLLTTQIAFTVTGPRRKLQEFRQGLRAEAIATIRADGFGTGIV